MSNFNEINQIITVTGLIVSGINKVAFILKPISIKAIKQVAKNNMYMPPKSTYIEPKLRSGLIIYPLN